MAYRQARFPGARRVLAQDVVDRYSLRRTQLSRLLPDNPALSVLLLFGDVEMEQLDLDPRSGPEGPAASFTRSEPDVHGLVVAGNLLVHGPIHHASAPIGLSLYVLGNLRARDVAISGLELMVRGDVAVRGVLAGSGPAGGARLDGTVTAKLLVSDGFPMLLAGRLAAPVLDTGRTRIGVVEDGKVREVTGDIPAAVVLAEEVLDPDGLSGFSYPRFGAALAARRPVLAADYLSGRTDVSALRELRRLAREIETALAAGDEPKAAQLMRQSLARGAPRAPATLLRLADVIYRVQAGSRDAEALREALDLLDEALGPDPDPEFAAVHPDALLQRAAILLRLREHDEEAFEQAWRDCSLVAPKVPLVQRPAIAGLMGQWLFARRRYSECVPYLRPALAADPSDGVLHGRLARALWLLDREEEALPHAGRSLELNPQDERMWFVRGKCNQVLGHIAAARLDLQTYLDAQPDDELAVAALVEIALGQGQFELAVEQARRFTESYPQIGGADARFGRLLQVHGLHERAIPFLRRGMEQEPQFRTAVVDLAVAIGAAGIEPPGLTTALRSLEVDPDGDHLAYLRAECNLALADPARAEPDLEDYVTRFPDAARALASLASIRLLQNRGEEAERLLADARRVAADDDYVEEVAERAGLARPDRVRVGRRASHRS